MSLDVCNIHHRFGNVRVLDDVSLSVAPGEIVCLLGPSGSGKSTLLRIVAGLEPLQQGEIRLDGQSLSSAGSSLPAEARHIGLVFQDHALFPHLSVAENLAFGLQHLPAAERRTLVTDLLADIGLAGYEARFPHTLSGGQQQRVALARALAPQPAAMLLDEPFASVDATLRRRLREDARQTLKASNSPTLVVTHDPKEALELADRIAVMVDGRIVAIDTPEAVWRSPADRFVAELFGDAEALSARCVDGRLVTAFGSFALPPGARLGEGDRVDVVVRPRDVLLKPGPSRVVVRDLRFLGDRYLTIVAADAETLRAISLTPPEFAVGDPVEVELVTDQVLIYPAS